MWSNVDCQHPLPPIKKTLIGKPKKLRQRVPTDLLMEQNKEYFTQMWLL